MFAVAGVVGVNHGPSAYEPQSDWSVDNLCASEGIQVNNTVADVFTDSYSDVFGQDRSLLESTFYKYEYTNGISAVTATHQINQVNINGTSSLDVSEAVKATTPVWQSKNKTYFPDEPYNLNGGTVNSVGGGTNQPLSLPDQKVLIATLDESRRQSGTIPFALSSPLTNKDVDRHLDGGGPPHWHWKRNGDRVPWQANVNNVIASVRPEHKLNLKWNKEGLVPCRKREHPTLNVLRGQLPPDHCTTKDATIVRRLEERKLKLDESCSLDNGRVISAVLHDDDTTKPMWDRLELDGNKWADKNKSKLCKMFDECKDLFDFEKVKPPFVTPDGKVYEIAIDLIDDTPIVRRAWRLSPEKEKQLDEHLNKLLAAGVIYPIDDSNYSAVTVMVKKPGRPNEVRITTDYRKLNDRCRKFAFMSPVAQELFNMTYGADTYSVVDVHSAFYCMAVKAGDQHKLAFSTHRGMFTYARMPQGFCNSPSALGAAFMKMLSVPIPGPCAEYPDGVGPESCWGKPALGNICTQFVDDICIFGKEKHHADSLDFIFKLMQRSNLSLRPDKCELGVKKVKYLGVELSEEGLRICPDKVKALHEAPRPTNPAGIRRFLGQAGFHRNWIPQYAQHTHNMTDNLKKGVKFQWDERHNAEYDYILKHLSSDTCLSVFSWGLPVTIRTDASSLGYGATLVQHDPVKGRQVVCYASKRLNDTESKRCARDLETGACTWACSKYRPLLMHQHFTIEGDHEPMSYLKSYQGNNRRLFNYALLLSDYNFTWKYKPGAGLHDPDHLSRHPGPLKPQDKHNPDAGFDAECGTDMVRHHIGDSMNYAPIVANDSYVSEQHQPMNSAGGDFRSKVHRTRRRTARVASKSTGGGLDSTATVASTTTGTPLKPTRVRSAHVVFYRNDKDGNVEVLVGKETKLGPRKNQFNVPGGKGEVGESNLEAVKRESMEEAGMTFGHTTLGVPHKLQLEFAGVHYDCNVFLKELDPGGTVPFKPRGSGKNPLRDVQWRKVNDLLKAFHCSDILRWACHQRLSRNSREPYVKPPPVKPPYLAPYWGRDVECGCNTTCAAAGSDTAWGSHQYQCKKVYEYVRSKQSKSPWNGTTDAVYRTCAPVPETISKTNPEASYNIISLDGGIGVDLMAVSHSKDFKVIGGCESNVSARKLVQERTGIKLSTSWQDWYKEVTDSELVKPIDVLACNTKLEGMESDPKVSTMLENIPKIVKALSPSMVYVTIPHPPTTAQLHTPASKQYYKLEKSLHAANYYVDAKILQSARIGGLTDEVSYVCIAHKLENSSVTWPEEVKKFGGFRHLLSPNADRRLLRSDYSRSEKKSQCDIDEFVPLIVGQSHGGGDVKCTAVADSNYPAPTPSNVYRSLTGENGGGCVTLNDHEARVITQPEQMRTKGFTERVIRQVVEHPGQVVQDMITTAGCVTTKVAMYEAMLKLLQERDTVKVQPNWGDVETKVAACEGRQMPDSVFDAGMIASGRCNLKVNGILQHVVMPSFSEIRFAQRNDVEIAKLVKYTKAFSEDVNQQAGVKPTTGDLKEQRLALHPLYRRHSEFFHISNGALFFRDVLNDEWLTDALVLPETLVKTAMQAFHDSAYGAHLGPHKTRVAMQERVWFPNMKQRVKTYCDNCGACKLAKVAKRTHAGQMKSSFYCEAGEYWAIDLQGPYLQSSDGMKYHCHMIDLTTKWNVSVALPDKKAATVCDAIHKHLIIGGPCVTPRTLLMDNGSEFAAEYSEQFRKQFGIKGCFATVAHPTGQSVCERRHRTYNSTMRTFCHKYGMDWSEALPYACYALNTHAIEGSNISPYELVYGRKPKDPNSLHVEMSKTDLWRKQGGPKFQSDEDQLKQLRARQGEVRDDVLSEFVDQVRRNQTQYRQLHYSHGYEVGDLVNRWTANPKVGVYGKLAYKSTGPYEVVSKAPHNRDVYNLKPIGKPDVDATAHHVRELCPYISRKAYEEQLEDSAGQLHDSMLEVKCGDYLLLPNGRRDFLMLAKKLEGPYVTCQYMNTWTPKEDPLTNLNLVWYRDSPSSTDEDVDEIYAPTLTSKQVSDGYGPWDEKIHLNHFYQRALTTKDLLKKKFKREGQNSMDGFTLSKIKRAGIKKCKPLHG